MNSGGVFLLTLAIFFIIVVLVAVIFYTSSQSNIGVIQQLTIPNFEGHEELLKSLTNNRLFIYNCVTPSEIASAINEAYWKGALKIILSVSSSALLDIEVQEVLNNYRNVITFVATASTLEDARTELPYVYYALTDDTTLINKAIYGFYPPLGGDNVFIGGGTDPYVTSSLEIAQSKGMYTINATDMQDFTSEQLTAISNSSAVFIVAFSLYQSFIVSQIPSDYSKFIIFVNLNPAEDFSYPTGATVKTIYPSTNLLISPSSEWNKTVRTTTYQAHPLLQCLPMLVSLNDWSPLFKTGTLVLPPNKSSENVVWSALKN